jgi:hypothetical protein
VASPSYNALQSKTGLCRARTGLARLERTGIVCIVRRLVRTRVDRISPITGEPESYVGTTQAMSLYAPGDHLERPAGRRAPFPGRRQLSLLEALCLSWKQSSRAREKPHPTENRGILVTGGPGAVRKPQSYPGERAGLSWPPYKGPRQFQTASWYLKPQSANLDAT